MAGAAANDDPDLGVGRRVAGQHHPPIVVVQADDRRMHRRHALDHLADDRVRVVHQLLGGRPAHGPCLPTVSIGARIVLEHTEARLDLDLARVLAGFGAVMPCGLLLSH